MKTSKKIIAALLAAAVGTGSLSCSAPENPERQTDRIRAAALSEWQEMKFGLFIHWGIFSVPAGVWKDRQIPKLGEQIQRHADIPDDEYQKLASRFNPTSFDADAIVKMAEETGMKYVVLTTKHHDGFCMFDSQYTDFDITDATPYKKDILQELAEACRKHGLKLGLYYSNPDWHFNAPAERNPADGLLSVFSKMSKSHEDYQVNQLTELLTRYGDITELFFDMGEPTLEQSHRFAETVHHLQPECVINGRIMNNQGDFLTMPDNRCPEVPIDTIAWEMPGTFYPTWGYKSWVTGSPLPEQIRKQIRTLSKIASRGGNFLLNIGPKADGTVPEYEVQALHGIAEWMKVNSAAIHGTLPTPFVRLPWGECTRSEGRLYLHVGEWPTDGQLLIPGLNSTLTRVYPLDATLLASADQPAGCNFAKTEEGWKIDLSAMREDPNLTIIVAEYEGALDITDPIIRPALIPEPTIIIPGELALKQEKYGKVSYRSILRDYSRKWDIDVPETGRYAVSICYDMKIDEKEFKLSTDSGSSLHFVLTGDGSRSIRQQIIDGNENPSGPKADRTAAKGRTVEAGFIEFDHTGRTSIILGPGKEFKMCATSAEDKLQDQRYRGMNINITSITLTKVSDLK